MAKTCFKKIKIAHLSAEVVSQRIDSGFVIFVNDKLSNLMGVQNLKTQTI